MDVHYDLLDYFLKWFIPFFCAGVFAVVIKPLVAHIKKTQQTAHKEDFHKLFEEEVKPLEEFAQTAVNASIRDDRKLEAEIDHVKADIETVKKEIQQSTAGLREALLVIHLRDLVADSKKYIQRGWITVDEWDDYDNRYKVYHMLGGNGHMDAWYPKVQQLPHHG